MIKKKTTKKKVTKKKVAKKKTAKKTTKKKAAKKLASVTHLQEDALTELSSITSGNATTALSKLLNKHIKISIPKAQFLNLQELTNELGGPTRLAMSIYQQVHGDLNGQAVFLFKRESAMQMIDLILNREKDSTKILDIMAESAFGEMSNIFSGSYLNSLSNLLDLKLLPGVPVIAADLVGPIVEYVFGRIKNPMKKVLCFRTKVSINNQRIEGEFIFMFDEKSFNKLLKRLDEKFDM